MVDKVIQGKTRTFREFGSFYTESDPILTYMVKKLNIQDRDLILEPCAGDGVFIKKILDLTSGKKFRVEAVDLNNQAVSNLNAAFTKKDNVTIRETDTLFDSEFDTVVQRGGAYDKVIGNPPYGAWQDQKKRSLLKEKYGGYVKETYTLFIARCLDLLKPNGKLVFIIPDTFLALNLHKGLRKRILSETEIEEILLMPSKFFPGVNFGYSNLSIISLVKKIPAPNHAARVIYLSNSVVDLLEIAEGNHSKADKVDIINQSETLASLNHSFLLGGDSKIRTLINNYRTRLSDVADCVTGFYSGDNKRFIRFSENARKIPNGYKSIPNDLIEFDYTNQKDIVSGLKNGKEYIPFLKGGNGRFKKNTDCFIKWDESTIDFYKKNKASRFQNSQYYFREGIGVPMVKSSKTHAFLLSNRLFDQSIVGVFPKNKDHLFYLLALLNSHVCSKILKTINHTANNSANYLRNLPVIIDEKEIHKIDDIIKKAIKDDRTEEALIKIDQIFDKLYKI